MRHGLRVQDAARFLNEVEGPLLHDELSSYEITTLLNLLFLLSACDAGTEGGA